VRANFTFFHFYFILNRGSPKFFYLSTQPPQIFLTFILCSSSDVVPITDIYFAMIAWASRSGQLPDLARILISIEYERHRLQRSSSAPDPPPRSRIALQSNHTAFPDIAPTSHKAIENEAIAKGVLAWLGRHHTPVQPRVFNALLHSVGRLMTPTDAVTLFNFLAERGNVNQLINYCFCPVHCLSINRSCAIDQL
jgi:hypothetical protein